MLFDDSPPSSLTGIARLAAQSPVLEAKSRVRYFEIETRSVLNRTRPGMPFRWTINPYRGCEFGCKYCYARYTHEFMGMEDVALFEDRIYAKSDLAPILRQELRKLDPAEPIAIGTATDPYQPAERRFRRTRSILEVFAAGRGRKLSITTKSDLVTRDVDLLRKIAESNSISVNITDHHARSRTGPALGASGAAAGSAPQRGADSRASGNSRGVFPIRSCR